MAFQSNAWQNNAFQEGPGTTDNPPSGKPDYLPYSPSQIYEWLPRWWLIPSSRQVGFPDVNPNPPFPGATALAALSLLVSTAWVAADPLPQLPRNVAATIPAAVVPYVPVGAQVQQAILNNWLPADPGPTFGIDLQPYQPTRLTPPISGPQVVATVPVGVQVPQAVLVAWIPPDPGPVLDSNAQPYQPRNMTPPISAQLPSGAVGSVVQPDAINQWWSVPPPGPTFGPDLQPYQPTRLVPPVSQQKPATVNGTFVPDAVQQWWNIPRLELILGPDLQAYQPTRIVPPISQQLPAATRGSVVQNDAVHQWWNIPPPGPTIDANQQPYGPINSTPPVSQQLPAASTRQNIDPAILAYWNRPVSVVDLQLANAVSVQPQPPVGAAVPQAVLVSWIPAQPDQLLPTPRRSPPTAGPVPQNPPIYGTRVPVEVHVSWLPPDPLPIVGPKVPPGTIPPSPPPPVKGSPVPQEVLIGWIPPPPQPITGPQRVPGAASQPTVKGSPVPVEVLIGWIPPPPDPIMGMGRVGTLEGTKLSPPQSGPVGQNPPFPGTKVSTEVLVSWIPPPPQPIVGQQAFRSGVAPSQPPVKGSPVPLEVLVGWIPLPPLPTLWPPFNAALAPIAVRVPYVRYQVETYVAWLPSDPAFQTGRIAPQSAPPSIGTPVTVPYPVRSWWELPPPDPLKAKNLAATPSGPVPQNPPFMGGARIPLEVLIGWIPPPPQPPIATQLSAGYNLGQPLRTDPRYITYAQPRVLVASATRPRITVTYAALRNLTTGT